MSSTKSQAIGVALRLVSKYRCAWRNVILGVRDALLREGIDIQKSIFVTIETVNETEAKAKSRTVTNRRIRVLLKFMILLVSCGRMANAFRLHVFLRKNTW